jgi:hypothetical protein
LLANAPPPHEAEELGVVVAVEEEEEEEEEEEGEEEEELKVADEKEEAVDEEDGVRAVGVGAAALAVWTRGSDVGVDSCAEEVDEAEASAAYLASRRRRMASAAWRLRSIMARRSAPIGERFTCGEGVPATLVMIAAPSPAPFSLAVRVRFNALASLLGSS